MSVTTLLNAVTTTGAGDGVSVTSPGCQVHVYSAAGSSCTVLIQGSQDNSVWHTLKSLSDPAAAPNGFVYQGTAMRYMRANVSARVSGTITAKLMTLDVDPGPWASIDSPVNTAGALAVTSLTNSGLTAGRVPYSGTGGLQEDSAALAYDGSYLTAPNFKNTAATAGRVPYAGSAKEFVDASGFTYVGGLLSAPIHGGGLKMTRNAYAVDGAISVAPQLASLTKDGVGAYTLAAPTATTHDGYVIVITSATARAHVVTFPAGKINGGSLVTATFGGAIGDSITLVAEQGVWLTAGAPRNVTIA